MASNSAKEKPELEDPLPSFSSPVWEHFSFPVKDGNGEWRLDEPERCYKGKVKFTCTLGNLNFRKMEFTVQTVTVSIFILFIWEYGETDGWMYFTDDYSNIFNLFENLLLAICRFFMFQVLKWSAVLTSWNSAYRPLLQRRTHNFQSMGKFLSCVVYWDKDSRLNGLIKRRPYLNFSVHVTSWLLFTWKLSRK